MGARRAGERAACSTRATRSSPTARAAAPRSRATRWRRTTRTPTTRRSGPSSRCAPARACATPTAASRPLDAGVDARGLDHDALDARSPTSGSRCTPNCIYGWSSIPATPDDLLIFGEGLEQAGAVLDARRTASDASSTCASEPSRASRAVARRAALRPAAARGARLERLRRRHRRRVRRARLAVVLGRLRHGHRRHRHRPHRAAVRRGRLPDRPALRPAAAPVRRRRGQDPLRRRPRAFAGLWFKDADPEIIARSQARAACCSTPTATATTTRSAGAATSRCSTTPPTSWFIRTTRGSERADRRTTGRIDWHPAARRRGPLRQLAGERGRLGAVAQPLLGHAAADLAAATAAGTSRRSARYAELFDAAGRAAAGERLRPRAVRPAPAVHRRVRLALRAECGDAAARCGAVEEVIDAWFDSGAMPFAQHHYPFENQELFRRRQLPRRLHLRGGGPDARLVLHPARPRRAALRRARLRALRRARATSTTSRAARCRSGSATWSSRWR